MRKAGGIIAIIAGIFGVLAAVFTLVLGGVASALQANNANVVVWLGWGGIVFSFLTIILGAMCINARSRMPGAFLILSALAGAVLGGTIVAIFMVLALVGGLLAVFAANPVRDDPAQLALAGSGDANAGTMPTDEIIARYVQQHREQDRPGPPRSTAATAAPAASGFGKRQRGAN